MPPRRTSKRKSVSPVQPRAALVNADVPKERGRPDESWISGVDLKAFKADMRALGKRLADEEGPEDVAHLEKIIMWSHALTLVGMAMLWMPPGLLLPAVFISLGITSRWTIVAHHVCHGGFDRASNGRCVAAVYPFVCVCVLLTRRIVTAVLASPWARRGDASLWVAPPVPACGSLAPVKDWFDWMLPDAWNVEVSRAGVRDICS